MNTATTVGVYVAGLVVTFGVAFGVGSAVGPVGGVGAPMQDGEMQDGEMQDGEMQHQPDTEESR